MDYLNEYRNWVNSPYIDEDTKVELLGIEDNQAEIRERFCSHLEFGTAGLRALWGRVQIG